MTSRSTKLSLLAAAALGVLVAGTAAAQSARSYIFIVGSSTVYPFSTVVAERFGKTTRFKTPKVESTGSGGGFKLFCDGVGAQYPDITNSSRRVKASEIELCAENGVSDVVEVKIGYDGIVLANSAESEQVTLQRRDIFLALAKEVPNPDGSETLVPNNYQTWNEINPDLPAVGIEVLGPPPTSGTRDAFLELAMEGGCSQFDWIKSMKKTDKKAFKNLCHTIREDGVYVEAGENDNLIVQKLSANPDAFGIFGFGFLDQNIEKVQGSLVDGVEPTFEAIADGSYPVSRSLYFYAKKAHVDVIPGMREFLAEFTSERAWGDEGYLSDRGLIPMPEEERAEVLAAVTLLSPVKLVQND
ncbi:MAG: substrate-binding domain-containing protein [Xanthomonadales bacterium]|nr:substrate-binding domain-containing protein [Xanthomonadales bacterium]